MNVNEHFDAENERIRNMFGTLFDAIFERSKQGKSVLKALVADYCPESEMEKAIWNELTAPRNYSALLQYFEYWNSMGTNLEQDNFHASIFSAAKLRPIEFDDLPEWLKTPIKNMRPNDYANWIHEPVPALRNRSVVTVFKLGQSGEAELREYITKVVGYFLVD
jgi:hypothetical protein